MTGLRGRLNFDRTSNPTVRQECSDRLILERKLVCRSSSVASPDLPAPHKEWNSSEENEDQVARYSEVVEEGKKSGICEFHAFGMPIAIAEHVPQLKKTGRHQTEKEHQHKAIIQSFRQFRCSSNLCPRKSLVLDGYPNQYQLYFRLYQRLVREPAVCRRRRGISV